VVIERTNKTRLALFVVLLLAAAVFAGYAFTTSLSGTDEKVDKNTARTQQLCDYAYSVQVSARHEAIKSYRRIPPGSRETLVLAGITLHPRKELRDNLRGRYGNRQSPPYGPQHDWPVKLPKDQK
jgi:hypothetical protein